MATIDNARSRYSTVAIGLHWLIGLAVIANICLAMLTEGLPRDVHRAAMGAHKALGMAILALTLVRILWRLVNKVPPLPGSSDRFLRTVHHSRDRRTRQATRRCPA